jgi:hypothetical protein
MPNSENVLERNNWNRRVKGDLEKGFREWKEEVKQRGERVGMAYDNTNQDTY